MYIPYGETSDRIVFFLWLFIPYGETVRSQFVLSMVFYPLRGNFLSIFFPGGNIFYYLSFAMVIYPLRGNRHITICSFYGFLSPTGKFSIHLFSRREYILLPFFCYGYLSPTGKPSDHNLFFLWFFIPYGEIFYPSFFPEGIYIHRKAL